MQCLFEAEASVFAGVVAAVDGVDVYVENVGDDANCQQDCYVAFFEWEFEATASVVNGEWVNFRKYRYLFLHLVQHCLRVNVAQRQNVFADDKNETMTVLEDDVRLWHCMQQK